MICAATTTKDLQGRELSRQLAITHGQVNGIAVIQVTGGVELSVAHRRCVRANSDQAAQPVAVDKRVLKVRRMRTVDHESRGRAIGQVVDRLDRIAKLLPTG